ncbi:hypothetical protein [Streptomyces sp. NPDC086010]|uniref:hypothetical protein n=1 Tax=Streptomyces sp. NPDC086010 TaxID=3365745 RepID=UPI0037D39F83
MTPAALLDQARRNGSPAGLRPRIAATVSGGNHDGGFGNGLAPAGQDRSGAPAMVAWWGQRLPGLVIEVARQLGELGVKRTSGGTG